MPVYVYKNLRTGERFEFEQRITEPALTKHPETGDPVKRLIQPVGIAFKGSGFYVNDSRSSSSGGSSSAGSSTSSSKDSSSDTSSSKSESKAASSATSGSSDS